MLITFLLISLLNSCTNKKKQISISEFQSLINNIKIVNDRNILDCFYIESDTAKIKTTILQTDTIMIKGDETLCFLTKTIPVSEKHDNALLTSLIGFVVYNPEDTIIEPQYFAQSGNFGGDPVYQTIKLKNGDYFVCLYNGKTMMGITEVDLEIYALDNGKLFKSLAIEGVDYDNSGYVGKDSLLLKTKTTNVKPLKNGLVIKTTTKSFNEYSGKQKEKRKFEYYTFSNGSFVLDQ